MDLAVRVSLFLPLLCNLFPLLPSTTNLYSPSKTSLHFLDLLWGYVLIVSASWWLHGKCCICIFLSYKCVVLLKCLVCLAGFQQHVVYLGSLLLLKVRYMQHVMVKKTPANRSHFVNQSATVRWMIQNQRETRMKENLQQIGVQETHLTQPQLMILAPRILLI